MKLPTKFPTSFFRNVYTDLVERRLLPLAALLLLALVAVPLVLAKSMPAAPVASAAPAPHLNIPSSEAAVSILSPETKGRLDGLKVNNPFVQHRVARRPAPRVHAAPSGATGAGPAKPSSSSSSSSSSTASSSPSPASSSPSPSTGTSSGPSSPSSSPPAPAVHHKAASPVHNKAARPIKHRPAGPRRYRIPVLVLRFGHAGARGRRSVVDSLASLPRGHTPVVVFLGMLSDGKTAEFYVAPHVKAQGDAKCRPSPRNCQTLRLRARQVEFFDAPGPKGTTVQYELDIGRVGHRWTTSLSQAIHAYASR